MNILIIGSKGFIGSHCVDHFSKKHLVFTADILPDDSSNYFHLSDSQTDFDILFTKQSFDVCINCSGAASVPDSLKDPLHDFTLNTVHVFKVLNSIARHQPGCRFLNLSSAAVYGNPDSLPITENAAVHPLSPYGWHKQFSEMLGKEFYTTKKIPCCSVRIFSAYGVRLKKQLFWDLYQKAKQSKQVRLFGTGNESRDFIYIHDLVKAIELVTLHAGFSGECINVANGREITLREAAETFVRELGEGHHVEFNNETRPGDPLNWCADISILKTFGYNCHYYLQPGTGHQPAQ